MKRWIRKIQQWNALIKFIVHCRNKETSLGKFKILTTTEGLPKKLKVIVVELDSNDNMGEQIILLD